MSDSPEEGSAVAESKRFFEALGLAIGNWQMVEHGLFFLLERIIACDDDKIMSAVFYSVHSTADKIRMADQAVKVALAGKPALDKWEGKDGLKERLSKASGTRHKLAHFDVSIGEEPMFIGRSWLDARYTFANRKLIDINGLWEAADTFNKLGVELLVFTANNVPERRPSRKTPDVQPTLFLSDPSPKPQKI